MSEPVHITLAPSRAAALALQHAAARYLDNPGTKPQLREAFEVEARRLADQDCGNSNALTLLRDALERLRLFPPAGANAGGALSFARRYAAELNAVVAQGSTESVCSLATFFGAAETQVRSRYTALSPVFDANPVYRIEFRPSKGVMRPSTPLMRGYTTVMSNSRSVTVVFWDEPLSAGHLSALIYVLFHELVCHAFQGTDCAEPGDVDADCIWSEGLMDMVALNCAIRWLRAAHGLKLLPHGGPTLAEAHIRQESYARNSENVVLGRAAFDCLQNIFAMHGDSEDPDQMGLEPFLMAVNSQLSPDSAATLAAALVSLDTDEPTTATTQEAFDICKIYMNNMSLDALILGFRELAGVAVRLP